MLVLTRRVDESIVIGNDVVVTVLEVRGEQVRIGIEAPRDVTVHRREVFEERGGTLGQPGSALGRPSPGRSGRQRSQARGAFGDPSRTDPGGSPAPSASSVSSGPTRSDPTSTGPASPRREVDSGAAPGPGR